MASPEVVKGWLNEIFAHDYAEKLAIDRAATAAGYGFNVQDYVRPFPGTKLVTNNISNYTGNGWKSLAVSGAMLLGGLGIGAAGTVGALNWMSKGTTAPVQQGASTVPTVPTVPLKGKGARIIEEKQLPDGSWIAVPGMEVDVDDKGNVKQ